MLRCASDRTSQYPKARASKAIPIVNRTSNPHSPPTSKPLTAKITNLHRRQQPPQPQITTGSSLKVPDIDYSKHKILLAVI